MYSALRCLGNVDFSKFTGAAAAQTMSRALGASHRRSSARSCRRFSPSAHALERMERKLVPRQDFTRGFTQSDGCHCEHENRHVENKADDKNDPAGNEADRGPLQE